MVLRMENPETEIKTAKKRKRESKPLMESNNLKLETDLSPKKLKNKKVKSAPPVFRKQETTPEDKDTKGTDKEKDISNRYPVLKNDELIHKFLSVPMTNNQKGRIRQLLKDSLKGTSDFLLPDVIHNRIQAILNSTDTLTETDLRKVRILYNMLKTALKSEKNNDLKKKNRKPNKNKDKTDKKEVPQIKNTENTEVQKLDTTAEQGDVKKSANVVKKQSKVKKVVVPKVKGPKRYVVFLGNLPPDIDKEKILQHFSEFNECIVDIRIPKRPEDKKSSIAYVELKNEPSYELALSKHHSMLGSKRINVLYTTQKNGKVSKTEAKSKSAKLIALQKAGKLIGSIPANRKRSHRRMKMKRAQAKLAAENA
ncbi:uncharacterized protein [Epargyreus clarus]|uniref:uncharacterized protein n=1 Tax=Epargyreus clarus TaxID=520877 RepID=UPI003C2F82C4